MKFKILIISLLLASLFPLSTLADGGMVIWPPDIHLDQLAQNAIVAWNGEKEIIILSNDIESGAQATALRIVPLPSNPTDIKEGSFDSFEKLVEIINQKREEIRNKGIMGEGFGIAEAPSPGIEIVFQEKIGAHDITVVKVNNLDYFLTWIEDFAKKKGFSMTYEIECKNYSRDSCPEGCVKTCCACSGGKITKHKISQEFREGVGNYLKREINYFVFDAIDTTEGKESINPLIYKFESDYLYYPILISGISEISESRAGIKVFFVTEDEISDRGYWHPYWQGRFDYPVELNQEELKEVSEDLANLFDGKVKVTIFDYYGYLKDIKKDLVFYPEIWQRNLSIGSQGEDVKALQKILINEGFWESDLEATGYFGPITANALIKLQEQNSSKILKPLDLEKGTGYFGIKSREILEESLSLSIEKVIKEMQFPRNLYLGMRGDDVKVLQGILIKEEVWERPDVGATGFFGPITQRAVIKFQEKYASEILEPLGLTEGTGFVGPSTQAYLEEISKK